ncbi:MAG TPA: Ig-like domain-containing protein [Bacteroidota bacterium]|nr:Ig-like domain-containing protein [Bacteroidota bacterium]
MIRSASPASRDDRMSVRPAFIRSAVAMILALFLFSCAGQVPPSGGPPDKTPPVVVSTYPTAGTLNFHDHRLAVNFNKYINSTKTREALFISPHISHLTFDWSYKGVEIQFTDTLRPSTTYILLIGTDAEDTHGNRLAQAFTLPFSTGDRIDSASISGRIYDPNPGGLMLFAYRLDGRLADTLNPSRTKPDFLTQTGADGSFSLLNLPPGHYRLLAVLDDYKDLLYDKQTDRYGVLPADLVLPEESSKITRLRFMMSVEDTSAPFLSSFKAETQRKFHLKFSKPVDPAGVTVSSVSLFDTTKKSSLTVQDISFTDSWTDAYVTTSPMDSPAVYRIGLNGIADRAGNRLSAGQSSLFSDGSRTADTGRPVVKLITGADSLKNIDPGDTIALTFSKPVRREMFGHGFTLLDSLRKNVPVRLQWQNSSSAFIAGVSLNYDEWYTARMILDSLNDFGEPKYHDSTLVRRFRTMSEESLGSIDGTVTDELPRSPGRCIIVLQDVLSRKAGGRKIQLDSLGAFSIDHVKEGKYRIWAFRDADSNGVYTFGTPFPFRPSERFTVYPDTLKIRARWPLSGVELRFTR